MTATSKPEQGEQPAPTHPLKKIWKPVVSMAALLTMAAFIDQLYLPGGGFVCVPSNMHHPWVLRMGNCTVSIGSLIQYVPVYFVVLLVFTACLAFVFRPSLTAQSSEAKRPGFKWLRTCAIITTTISASLIAFLLIANPDGDLCNYRAKAAYVSLSGVACRPNWLEITGVLIPLELAIYAPVFLFGWLWSREKQKQLDEKELR